MTLPNKLTLFRVLLVPVFMFFSMPAAKWYSADFAKFLSDAGLKIGLVVFLVAALTDILDGNLARKRGEVTNLGKFMDPLADKLLVLAGFLVLMVRFDLTPWFILIVFARELMVAGVRMVAAGEGKVIAASIWGKIKTVTQIVAIVAYLLNDFMDMLYFDDILMWFSIILTIYSGIDYLLKNIKILKKA